MSSWSRPPISRTLPPHIYAGVSSILHFISSITNKDISKLDEETLDFFSILRMPEEEDTDDFKEVVKALIVAVYFLALARRRSPSLSTATITASPSGSSTSPSKEGEARKMDNKTFSEMRQTALSSLGLPTGQKRHREDVDSWIALIMGQKWAKGQEWFDNIPMAGEREDELGDEYGSDSDGENDGPDTQGSKRRRTNIFLHAGKDEEGLLLPGLGTMMQDRVHYLSEDRRDDYLEWKADILQRIGKVKVVNSRGGKAVAA
jgi:origin recognition complex subunit 6